MPAGSIWAIVCAIIAAGAAICSIIAFFHNRGKDRYNSGQDHEEIKSDIKYMRNNFDNLRLDVKEVARKQDSLSERVIRVEESTKQAHKRIDDLSTKSKTSSKSKPQDD